MPTIAAQPSASPVAPSPDQRPPAGGTGPDINIPPPNGTSEPPATTATTGSQTPPSAAADLAPVGMSSTQIVIAIVLVLAWGGLLLLVRRLVTQSLLAQFADLGRSRAAGTGLYVFLLALGATVIVCALGGFWKTLVIMIPVTVLDIVLLVLALVTLASARSSRQRR